MRLTTLDLPGVFRIEEASNKAIERLQRSNTPIRATLTVLDEGVLFQPGDVLQIVSTNRGVDFPMWVEQSVMVSYGRHQVTGIMYADEHFSDTAYCDADEVGKLSDKTENNDGWLKENTDVYGYSCRAFDLAVDALNPLVHWPGDDANTVGANVAAKQGSAYDLIASNPSGWQIGNITSDLHPDFCTATAIRTSSTGSDNFLRLEGFPAAIAGKCQETGTAIILAAPHEFNGKLDGWFRYYFETSAAPAALGLQSTTQWYQIRALHTLLPGDGGDLYEVSASGTSNFLFLHLRWLFTFTGGVLTNVEIDVGDSGNIGSVWLDSSPPAYTKGTERIGILNQGFWRHMALFDRRLSTSELLNLNNAFNRNFQ